VSDALVTTGVLVDVIAHVSAIVCLWSSRAVLTVHGDAARGPRHPPADAAHAAPARP